MQVSQLAGYVSEHSAYHHGDVSLTSTIVGMAQNFVGSNNVNLLYPSGQLCPQHAPLSAACLMHDQCMCTATEVTFSPWEYDVAN